MDFLKERVQSLPSLNLLAMYRSKLLNLWIDPGSTSGFVNISVTLTRSLSLLCNLLLLCGGSCNCQQSQSHIWPTDTFC